MSPIAQADVFISQKPQIKKQTGRSVSTYKNVIMICKVQYSAKVLLGSGEGHLNIALGIGILFKKRGIGYIRCGEKKSIGRVSGYFAAGR